VRAASCFANSVAVRDKKGDDAVLVHTTSLDWFKRDSLSWCALLKQMCAHVRLMFQAAAGGDRTRESWRYPGWFWELETVNYAKAVRISPRVHFKQIYGPLFLFLSSSRQSLSFSTFHLRGWASNAFTFWTFLAAFLRTKERVCVPLFCGETPGWKDCVSLKSAGERERERGLQVQTVSLLLCKKKET